jgi:hypothetical protein
MRPLGIEMKYIDVSVYPCNDLTTGATQNSAPFHYAELRVRAPTRCATFLNCFKGRARGVKMIGYNFFYYLWNLCKKYC